VGGEAFDARAYLLTTPAEPEQKQAQEDNDVRAWFLGQPGEG
jgi:hypothetical protein